MLKIEGNVQGTGSVRRTLANEANIMPETTVKGNI
jgi:hypothetical protein